MKKVLLLQGYIPHYRIPIFNRLGAEKDINLTIAHSGKSVSEDGDSFKELIVPMLKWKNFKWQYKIPNVSNYDIVVGSFDIHWLSSLWILFRKPTKVVLWGIGKGRNKFVNLLRKRIVKRTDGLILYSDQDAEYFANDSKKEIFIANNTLSIPNSVDYSSENKKYFIFVGSLYKGKGLETLIEAYSKLNNSSFDLVIIGDGSERENIEHLVESKGLSERVHFEGFINDNTLLAEYYKYAICSISPHQAGLSVLQSMAFGVPFITRTDAYSGGEKLNIEHEISGYFYNTDQELVGFMQNLVDNGGEARRLGHNAFVHFNENRSVDNMVSGFLQCFKEIKK